MGEIENLLLIPGIRKAGTTTLFQIVKRIDNIRTPHQKEPHFFTVSKKDIERHKEWYKQELKYGAKDINVDASTSYLSCEESLYNVKSFADQVKLVVALRHPVERLYSAYLHNKTMVPTIERREINDITERMYSKVINGGGTVSQAETEIIAADSYNGLIDLEHVDENYLKKRSGFPSKSEPLSREWPFRYFETSLYKKKIDMLNKIFGHENVKVYKFEDIINKQHYVQQSIAEFLGCSISDKIDYKHHNKTRVPSSRLSRALVGVGKKVSENLILKVFENNETYKRLKKTVKSFITRDKPEVDQQTYKKIEEIINESVNFYKKLNRLN